MGIRLLAYADNMQMRRVTVTVDGDLLDDVAGAVAEGRASSVSAWVAEAIAQRSERDRRLHELAGLVAEYEAEHGSITEEELATGEQTDRDAAALLRARVRRAG